MGYWTAGHWKMGPAACPETLADDCQPTLSNKSEEQRPHPQSGRSLQYRKDSVVCTAEVRNVTP
jgi:hypothetical protein